jgi:hypothetical protein
MKVEKSKLTLFERQIFDCVKGSQVSVAKVQANYGALHPHGSWREPFSLSVNTLNVARALRALEEQHELLTSDLVRWYEGESLKEDIRVYTVSGKGISFLLPKGKKT